MFGTKSMRLFALAAGTGLSGMFLFSRLKTFEATDGSEFETLKFPHFPAGAKSLLSKYLTREIWDQYRGVTDKHGFTLGMAINSGVKNPESSVGVYAGSQDSYETFSALFDPIIEDYHQFKSTDVHHSSMNASRLKDLPDLDPTDEFIISTRIRVARNLSDLPLGTLISKNDRKRVEQYVTSALCGFTGDLKGKYYSLETMSRADQKQLIEDHFLFKEGDKYLAACGLNRDWPSARGIFHNDAKSFLVWVNEEDQLRIISMQKGGNIYGVFERLCRAAIQIEKQAKFAHSKHLGYITTCPTNLGTGLRASVHVKLPLLSKNKARFQAIADDYHVQIRGVHGEHSESEGGVYDISNKRRLGRSEADLVLDMYNGVKAMIDAEKELMSKR